MGTPHEAHPDVPADGAHAEAPIPAARCRADRGPLRRATGHAVTALAVLVVALLAVLSALRWIDTPTPTWLPTLQALVPAALPPALVVLLVAARTRRRVIAVAAGAVAAVHLVLGAPWWIPGEHVADEEGGDPLVVVASNVQFGFSFPDIQLLVDEVRTRDADVLLLIEAAPGTEEVARAAGIGRHLPHAMGVPRPDAGGAFIFSRYPLTTDGVPELPVTRYALPTAVVRAPQGDVMVMAVHTVAPLAADAVVWHRELTSLASWAAVAPTSRPLVLAGDFNASSDHPAFRRFAAAGLYDAQREVGRGRRRTWPERAGPLVPPFVDLDHILLRGMDVGGFDRFPVPGTDHYAVSAELVPGDG